MPIHVLTGLPGASKTAEMIMMLLEEADKKNPRPLYAWGIDGLDPGLATVIPDITKWNDIDPNGDPCCDCDAAEHLHAHVVPNGAKVFVDEAWKAFGHLQNASRQQTPPHVLALAEHRHRGIDFVFTTQAPAQLYPFCRSMIEQHWHIVRKFGTKLRDVYKWGELQDDVKSEAARARAEKSLSAIPAKAFGRYKSASEHTIKPRLPAKLVMLPIMALFVVGAIYGVYRYITRHSDAPATASDGLPSVAAQRNGAPVSGSPTSLSEYLAPLAMRAPGLHGSQPIFDGRDARAEPRTFCVMSGGDEGDERCRCYTEQATRLFDVREDVCRHVARWGGYDPFLAPIQAQPLDTAEEVPASSTPRVSGSRASPEQVATSEMGQVWGRAPDTLRASGGG